MRRKMLVPLLPARWILIGWFLYRPVLFPVTVGLALVAAGLGWTDADAGTYWRSGWVIVGLLLITLPCLVAYTASTRYVRGGLPKLAVTVRGPIVSIRRTTLGREHVNLGCLFVGRQVELRVIVHNISNEVVGSVRISARCQARGVEVSLGKHDALDRLGPGEAVDADLKILAQEACPKRETIRLVCQWRGGVLRKAISIDGCVDGTGVRVKRCSIERWKGGARAAFCWRADVDGLDNLSNEVTLSRAFALARRFKVPISLFISSRLSLVHNEWAEWVTHLPGKWGEGDTSVERFNRWISFLKSLAVEARAEYPCEASGNSPCTVQVGSHNYYHYHSSYGYDASAATGWRSNVSPGEFRHPWATTAPWTAASEVLDNLREDARIIQTSLSVRPTSWAAPGDVGGEEYVEALGSLGLFAASEAVPAGSPRFGLFLAPYRPDLAARMPIHPAGSRVVETFAHVRRFDPHTTNELMSVKRAIDLAVGSGVQLTCLIHPHLRTYSPFFGEPSAERCVEEVLRFLTQDMGSQIWITSHFAIAEYWDAVLCPQHRRVQVSVDQTTIEMVNSGDRLLREVPIDVELEDGRRIAFLVDLDPMSKKRIDLASHLEANSREGT